MNTIEQLQQQQLAKLSEGREMPEFAAGDTLRVNVRVIEGERERVQAFEGVCIARKNAGINSSFTVRKLSYGEGVERVFPLYSPRVESVEVLRRGRVRRAKLYYLRGRTGKAARIAEKTVFRKGGKKKAEAVPEEAAAPATAAEAFESEEAVAEAQVATEAPAETVEAAPSEAGGEAAAEGRKIKSKKAGDEQKEKKKDKKAEDGA